MNNTLTQITSNHEIKIGSRIFKYYFTPALSPHKPCICILHGHGYATHQCQFKYPNWNVVCPIDDFGYEQMGSWYLGEDNDFFWIDAIKSIINEIYSQNDIGSLFFWGSSMGGYAALVYGYMLNAKSIYANIPQTYLLGSDYSNSGMEKYFRKIGDDLKEFNDLKILFKYRSRKKYFLCFNQLEHSGRYFKEQGLPFINHLHSLGQSFYCEIRPLNKHKKNHTISESISLFNMYN